LFQDLGRALYSVHQYDEAILNLKKSLTLGPEDPEAYHYLGRAQAAKGDWKDAIISYQKAIALGHNEAAENLADALYADRQYNEAVRNYQEAIQTEPDSPEAHYGLARALRKLNREKEALQELSKATKLDPKLTPPTD